MKCSPEIHLIKTQSKRAQCRIKQDGSNEQRRWDKPEDTSPSGRGQGEGLRVCQGLRPSPGASRVPLPEGEGLPSTARVSCAAFRNAASGVTVPVRAALSQRWRISDACAYSGMRGRTFTL